MIVNSCPFYTCSTQPAIRKSLVYKIECCSHYSYATETTMELIEFYLPGEEEPIKWVFDDDELRDTVFHRVIAESDR